MERREGKCRIRTEKREKKGEGVLNHKFLFVKENEFFHQTDRQKDMITFRVPLLGGIPPQIFCPYFPDKMRDIYYSGLSQ